LFDNMKRLGSRAAFLNSYKNVEAGTKRPQTIDTLYFLIVCCGLYFIRQAVPLLRLLILANDLSLYSKSNYPKFNHIRE